MNESKVEAARDVIDRSAPGAVVLTSREGSLTAEALVKALGERVKPVREAATGMMCAEGHEGCNGDHDGHAHRAHREGVSTAFCEMAEPVRWDALLRVLPEFMDRHGPSLLRLKGSVRLVETGGYYALQAMPGEGLSRTPMPVAPGAINYRTGLTIIAHGVSAGALVQDLTACMALAGCSEAVSTAQSGA